MAAHHAHLSHEEKKKIRSERKILRKDLKLKGITSREEFEKIAQMLGLVIYEDRPWILFFWWRFRKWFLALGALKYVLMISIALLAVFPFAVLSNQKGNFMVSMTDAAIMSGFELSETQNMVKTRVVLKSEVLKEVNPYSVKDLPDDLNDYDGSHNLADVVAFTFYIRNGSKRETQGYDYYLILNNATRDIEEATWLMLYEEDKMIIYAKADEDGNEEVIGACIEPPLYNQSADPGSQYREEEDGTYTVIGKPYFQNNVVTMGTVEGLKPGEIRKYTAVIWIDGDDPDCSDNLIGGHGGFHMRITTIGDTDDLEDQFERVIE